MAEKKMTNAEALALSIELAAAAGKVELVEKLNRMYETATKPRKKGEKKPSKARLQNEAMAKEIGAHAPAEPFGTDWIMDNIQYVTSAQKASAVVKVAIELGIIEKVDDEKGKARYRKL